MFRKQESCDVCGESSGHPRGTVTTEVRNGVPVEVAWACSKGHEHAFPQPPRTPLHQGAVYLDEVAGLLEASEDEVAEAVEDGLLVTGFGGKGVWLGDLVRWKLIREALVSRAPDERSTLKSMLIERMAVKT